MDEITVKNINVIVEIECKKVKMDDFTFSSCYKCQAKDICPEINTKDEIIENWIKRLKQKELI